jgi:hypothetical protein
MIVWIHFAIIMCDMRPEQAWRGMNHVEYVAVEMGNRRARPEMNSSPYVVVLRREGWLRAGGFASEVFLYGVNLLWRCNVALDMIVTVRRNVLSVEVATFF